MGLSLECVEVITLGEGSNIDFSISVIILTRVYCNLSEREHTNTHRWWEDAWRSFIFNCHLVNSIVNLQARFLLVCIDYPQARERATGTWNSTPCCLFYCFFTRWTCLEDKDNLSTRTIWSATVQHIVSLVMMIIANTQTDACSTPAEENDKHESHLLIWTTDTDKSGRKRLVIYFSFESKDED